MLGKLPVPGRPTILITVGQGPTALAVGADGGCLNIFTLIYPFSSLSPSLWETARYRLKYCLKGPLNPKQPTKETVQSAPTLVCNSYRMSARGAWIGTTSARGNVNSKRRQPRGVYIPRAEVIPVHAPRARIR